MRLDIPKLPYSTDVLHLASNSRALLTVLCRGSHLTEGYQAQCRLVRRSHQNRVSIIKLLTCSIAQDEALQIYPSFSPFTVFIPIIKMSCQFGPRAIPGCCDLDPGMWTRVRPAAHPRDQLVLHL